MKLGTTELLIILAIVILLFGPTQIPKLTRMIRKSRKSFQDGMEEAEKDSAKPSKEAASGKDE